MKYALGIGADTSPGRARRRARVLGRGRRRGLHHGRATTWWPTRRRHLLLHDRHAGLLAPRVPVLPAPRRALHRRAGLLQARHRRGDGHAGEGGHEAGGLPLRRLPPAQRQVPHARGQDARLHARADRARAGWCRLLGNTYSGASPHRASPRSSTSPSRATRSSCAPTARARAATPSSSRCTDRIAEVQDLAPKTRGLLDENTIYLEYGEYAKFRGKIRMATSRRTRR